MNPNPILTALGPLAELYESGYDLIVVDAPDRVYVHDANETNLVQISVRFESVEELEQVIAQLMAFGGIHLSPADSTGEIRLPDGSRVTAVLPPNAIGSPYLVIQKVPDHQDFTWDNLLKWTTLTEEASQLFQQALHLWTNILVVGDMRNPKNYLLNLLANSIDPNERVIVVAETFKLPVSRHPRCIHLEPGGPAKLTVHQLLEVAARMRPNWLVLSDLQGPEVNQAIQLMKSGYPTLATLCADTPEDALMQIEAMVLRSNPNMGLMEIRQMIASAFGLVVFLKTHALPEQRIRVTQIIELNGLESDRYRLQPLFHYDNENGRLVMTDAGSTWTERRQASWTRG